MYNNNNYLRIHQLPKTKRKDVKLNWILDCKKIWRFRGPVQMRRKMYFQLHREVKCIKRIRFFRYCFHSQDKKTHEIFIQYVLLRMALFLQNLRNPLDVFFIRNLSIRLSLKFLKYLTIWAFFLIILISPWKVS